jgi:hypothetical protein
MNTLKPDSAAKSQKLVAAGESSASAHQRDRNE